MRGEVTTLVGKCQRGLRAAWHHLEDGDHDFCVSRAYYAMFHMTEALLLTKELTSSSHSGLLTLFYESFIKSGLLDKTLHQDLHRAFGLRQQGDYWADSKITRETAEDLLQRAERFAKALEKCL